jgi:hypothetical protein
MSNLSDKEIDRLSREAAEFYEPDPSSLSWSRLEQKLTVQMPERPPDGFRFGRINPYIWGPALVLFAGLSFFITKNIFYSQHSTPTNNSESRINSSVAKPGKQGNENILASAEKTGSSASADAKERKNNSLQNNSDKSAEASGPDSDKKLTPSGSDLVSGTEKNSGTHTRLSANHVQSAASNPAISSAIPSAAVFSSGNSRTGIGSNGASGINGNNKKTGQTSSLSSGIQAGGDMENKTNQFMTPLMVSAGAPVVHVTGNKSLLNRNSLTNTVIPVKSMHINRSLNFGLTFGTGYTDAGGITNDQLDNSIGLTVGYYLTGKLSINSGMLYLNKFYWAPGDKQNSAGGAYNTQSFATPAPVKYINGAANIWELPLTLRYDFAKNQKTKFFANAGLSSYFIMKQTSIYFYDNSYFALKTIDNSQVNYWFDVADVSLGLETEIGKGFSFQIEPYMKLPLKNMGIENVKLNTYGIQFSFRYTPVLSRSKK